MLKFEIKNLSRNPFVGLLSALLLVLILFATFNGKQRVDNQLATIQKLKEKENKFYENHRTVLDSIEKGLKQPLPEASWYKSPEYPITVGAIRGSGSYAVLTPAPLSAVSTGQSDLFPYYFKVAVGNTNAGRDNDNFENPFNTAQGQFDLAFVLTFILPLLIIALTYNILSAERERGTLPLLLSMPLNIKQWLLQKLVFNYLFINILIFVLLALSFAFFGISLTDFSFVQLLFALALYSLFWFGMAYLVNSLGKSSSFNAMSLLGVWLFFTLLVPSTVNMLATALYPVPSRVEFVTAQRQMQNQTEKQKEKILAAFYQKNAQFERKASESEKTWQDWWREGFAEDEYAEQMLQKIKQDFQAKANAQRNFANGFQYVSPVILFQNTLNQIAKTDTKTYMDFQEKVEDFEKEWSAYFKGKFMKNEKLTTKDYANFPKFEKESK
ncbi:MAG: DUF3526 domain-containing protein [Thermoflexibacter sp.]|jgi:ABC-2 type transport system permease protein|nr:DUF3526 domain-containing protein [Thermoflexibacter sp.]